MLHFLLTLAVGALLGCLLHRVKLPAGMIIGAIIGAALLNIFWEAAFVPPAVQTAAQILTGIYIGCSVTRDDIRKLRSLTKPVLLVTCSFLILPFIAGFIMYYVSDLGLLTALFSAIPGGITNIPLIAMDFGADPALVSVLQFVRMFVGIAVFPSMIAYYARRRPDGFAQAAVRQPTTAKANDGSAGHHAKRFVLTLAVGTACGCIGWKLGIPAGAMTVAIIGVMVFNLCTSRTYFPNWLRYAAQLLAGVSIGCTVNHDTVAALRTLIIPALVLVTVYTVSCLLIGNLLHKRYAIPIKEGLLAATPAGATDILLISVDLGVDSPNLVVFHICRLLTAVLVLPQLIYWLFA